jgi:hypothetical protein
MVSDNLSTNNLRRHSIQVPMEKILFYQDHVMNRALPYSMSDDIFADRSLSRFGE